MATHYINWADAKQYLDKAGIGDIDVGKLLQFSEVSEDRFDNRLRPLYDVPFTLVANPEAFDIAKKVCGMWTAAMYLRWSLSVEGDEEHAWWAKYLDQLAEELITQLENHLMAPDDAEDADNPLQFIPYDGDPDRDPIFKRANVASGTGHW